MMNNNTNKIADRKIAGRKIAIELALAFVAFMYAFFFLIARVSPFVAAAFALGLLIPSFTFVFGPVWGFMWYFPTTFVLAIRIPGFPYLSFNQVTGILFIIGWLHWWWRGKMSLTRSGYLALLTVTFIYFMCSALFGEAPAEGLVAFKTLVIYYVLVLVIASMLTTKKDVATFSWIILIATFGHALVGFAEYFTNIDLLVKTRARWMGSFRINAASHSAVVYGHYLLFAFPFGYYLFSEAKNATRRTLTLFITLFILLVSVLTLSRQVMIILALYLLLAPLLFKNRYSKTFIIIVLIVVFLSSPYVATKVIQRLKTLKVEEIQKDRSVVARSDALKVGKKMFQQKPVFGIGLGSFPAMWLSYVGYDTYFLHLDRDPEMKIYTDSTYTQLVSETGLVGLFLVLLVYYNIIAISWKKRKQSLQEKNRALANFASIVLVLIIGLLVKNIVEDTLLAFRTWVLFGLALCLQKPNLLAGEKTRESANE
jgi:O-antigen ligase